mmetsp:Transcript_28341/g.81983  ORF Transcript_28341/g.81983 Transcript_28341/m.81983 type:complete len:128 (-) Transcript_28341:1202-1585(-)
MRATETPYRRANARVLREVRRASTTSPLVSKVFTCVAAALANESNMLSIKAQTYESKIQVAASAAPNSDAMKDITRNSRSDATLIMVRGNDVCKTKEASLSDPLDCKKLNGRVPSKNGFRRSRLPTS